MAKAKTAANAAAEVNEQETAAEAVETPTMQDRTDELMALAREQQAEIEKLRKQLDDAKRREGAGPVVRKTDRQMVKEASEKAAAEGRNPWDVRVTVRSVPRVGTTEKHYWLGVNGRFLALPADDKYYDLQLPFAEALMNAIHGENFAKEYADKNIKVYDLISNPHEEEKEM